MTSIKLIIHLTKVVQQIDDFTYRATTTSSKAHKHWSCTWC